jgi:hypothetical protein
MRGAFEQQTNRSERPINVWKNRYNNYSSPGWIVFATAELDENSITD